MSLGPDTWITQHAIRRYCQRIRPGADHREGRVVLAAVRSKAVRVSERTFGGQVVWLVADPPMRLVTKHDQRMGCAILVTVLAPEEPWEDARLDATQGPQEPLPRPTSAPSEAHPSPIKREACPASFPHQARPPKTERRAAQAPQERQAAAQLRAKRHAEHLAFIAAAEQRQQARREARLLVTTGRCVLCEADLDGRVSPWRRVHDGGPVCAQCGEGLDEVLAPAVTE